MTSADLICPWCQKSVDFDPEDGDGIVWDESEHEVECPHCDGHFFAYAHVSTTYTTEKGEAPPSPEKVPS